MLYALRHDSDQEREILEQHYKGRRPVLPQWLREAPSIWPGLADHYAAFHELSTCRSFGMGMGPIPWTATTLWADRSGLDGEEREDLLYFIRRLDNAYLAYCREKTESEMAAAAKPFSGGTGGGR